MPLRGANKVTVGVGVAGVPQAKRELTGFRGEFDKIGKSSGFRSIMQGVGMGGGLAMWGAVSSAISTATDFMGDSIGVASGLAESMSKANVVFGKSVTVIDDFAETSAESFGISERAAYEATGSFGNLFTTMGLGQDAAADMSVKVTSLAADLASFHNIGIEDALQKLRSGLVGEAEPMRALGVMLDEATVSAKAMEMGLADATGEVSASAKVQARYALILEQSSNAQGDFARTSDGLANSQRVLNAMLEDVQAEIGEELIPVMLQLARVAKDDVLPAISDTVGAFGHLQWAMEEQRRKTDELMFWQRGLLGLWTDSQFSAEAYAKALEAQKRAAEAGAEGYAALARSMGDTTSSGTELNAMLRETAGAKPPTQIVDGLEDVEQASDDARASLKKTRNAATDLWESLIEDTKDAGKKYGYSYGSFLRAEVRRWINLTINEVRRLDGITYIGPGRNSAGYEHRASGGPVTRGEAYVVGEEGPELFVPRSAGTIVPTTETATTGRPLGGVTFVYSPTYSSASPGEARHFASAVMPELVRQMRRQQVLA